MLLAGQSCACAKGAAMPADEAATAARNCLRSIVVSCGMGVDGSWPRPVALVHGGGGRVFQGGLAAGNSTRCTLKPWAASSAGRPRVPRSEEHTSELQSQSNLVCRLLLEKKKKRRAAAPD